MQGNWDTGLVCAMVFLCFALGAAELRADTLVNPSTEYLNRIKGAETIQPLGDTPFGESISLFNGGLSFRQTDISYPGIGPAITLSRSYEASGSPLTYGNDLPMADWDLSIPRIATVVSGDRMGNVGIWKVQPSVVTQTGSTDVARCTHFGEINHAPYGYGLSWWHGYQLITGDGSSQPLLKRTASNTLAPGNNVAAYLTSRIKDACTRIYFNSNPVYSYFNFFIHIKRLPSNFDFLILAYGFLQFGQGISISG